MSLNTALLDTLKGNFVPKEVKRNRLSFCNGCPSNISGVCKECTCVLSWKTAMPKEKCDLGKWDVYVVESDKKDT